MAEAPCSPGYQQVSAHQARVQGSECRGVLVCCALEASPQAGWAVPLPLAPGRLTPPVLLSRGRAL